MDDEIRATHNLADKKVGKRGGGGEERARRGSQKRTGENPGNAGSSEYQEKESNLRPGLFSCIRRRRVTFVLDFR
jgi:hypothetical protein